jgi:copper homeostasis protein
MIRPRGGDFLYSEDELSIMRDDIALASQSGADGMVLGLLKTSGDVDVERTRELIDLAKPMQVTFHRAIDMSRDLDAALEAIIAAGANRVLTSGAAINAIAGAQQIAHLVQLANNRIQVMVAGSVRPENVAQIAAETRATHFHAALRTAIPSAMKHENRTIHLGAPGADDYVRYVTQAEDVRRLRQAMDAFEATGS